MKRLFFIALLCAFIAMPIRADIFFNEDFEGDLTAWVGQGGGAHYGQIITDPLNAGNNVLNFTAMGSSGDIFTATAFALSAGQSYSVSFDYLGVPGKGGVAGDLGGYAGLAAGFPDSFMWYYGTGTATGATDVLVDDGAWHRYTYNFTAPVSGHLGDFSNVRLMFEDYRGSGGVAGDAYFDNISLVPAPGAVLLGMIGLGVAGLKLRKFA